MRPPSLGVLFGSTTLSSGGLLSGLFFLVFLLGLDLVPLLLPLDGDLKGSLQYNEVV
jgi:hypothetical protein